MSTESEIKSYISTRVVNGQADSWVAFKYKAHEDEPSAERDQARLPAAERGGVAPSTRAPGSAWKHTGDRDPLG